MSYKETLTLAWKQLAQTKNNTAVDMVYYVLFRSIAKHTTDFQEELITDFSIIDKIVEDAYFYLYEAFSKITNKNKLANGRRLYDRLAGIISAWYYYHTYGKGILYANGQRKVQATRLGIELTEVGDQNLRMIAGLMKFNG